MLYQSRKHTDKCVISEKLQYWLAWYFLKNMFFKCLKSLAHSLDLATQCALPAKKGEKSPTAGLRVWSPAAGRRTSALAQQGLSCTRRHNMFFKYLKNLVIAWTWPHSLFIL